MTLGDFLRTRRAALTPEAAGIAPFGRRRVPGLRREELAQLAGVSPAYYTRLEQGQSANASPSVLDALARALNLDEDERAHLHELASSPATARPRASRPQHARASLVALLDAMPGVPAVVMDPRSEVLAWNDLGHRLLAGHVRGRPNLTRMLFLDAHTRELYRDWEQETARAVASLRFIAGHFRDDRRLAELIGELTLKSPEFAALWAKHPVARCTSGLKRMHHPEVGDLDLRFEVLHLPDDSGQRLLTHTAAPGSEAALALLKRSAAPRP
jgi:transcriptional regulator with XRE-family HTH domain